MTKFAALEQAQIPAATRAERRLALLEDMAEIGMRLLRRLDTGQADADADTAEAFARISRAVRLTLALEEKTDRFLAELNAGPQGQRDEQAQIDHAAQTLANRKAAVSERKASALDLLVAVSESEGESLESFEALCEALVETADEAEAAASVEPPLDVAIAALCDRLGLTPELSARVAEGWNAGYLAGRPRFNPWRPAPPDSPLQGEPPPAVNGHRLE